MGPTVLTGITPDMRIAQEETFGPVAPITVVRDDEEALALANGTRPFLGRFQRALVVLHGGGWGVGARSRHP